MNDRLRKARLEAGYRSAAAAARAHGWNEATYRHHENGTRGFDFDHSRSYAQAFGVRVSWLVGIDDTSREQLKTLALPNTDNANMYVDATEDEAAAEAALADRLGLTLVPHVDFADDERPWLVNQLSEGKQRIGFPTNLLNQLAKVSPKHCFSLRWEGSSMAPTIRDGAHILIDGARAHVDTHDDLWLLWQGSAPMVRRVRSHVDGSMTLLADNPSVPPQLLSAEAFQVESLDAIEIVGKVIWIGQAP